jgi:hypothetical protein
VVVASDAGKRWELAGFGDGKKTIRRLVHALDFVFRFLGLPESGRRMMLG